MRLRLSAAENALGSIRFRRYHKIIVSDGYGVLGRVLSAPVRDIGLRTRLHNPPPERNRLSASNSFVTALALGGNVAGKWGNPRSTFVQAIEMLVQGGVDIIAVAPIYGSRPLGSISQPEYLNTVLVCRTPMAPARMMALCKRIERAAGRRIGPRWGPRCLDIDIVTVGGRVIGFRGTRRSAGRAGRAPIGVILPHREAHRRAFVLQPLADVVPNLVHPVLKRTVRQLLAALPPAARHGLRRCAPLAIDPAWLGASGRRPGRPHSS